MVRVKGTGKKLADTLKYVILWLFRIFKYVNSLFYFKWVLRTFSDNRPYSFNCLEGKTAIVTGGNSGIGFATSVLLASRGCRVIIACRRDATLQRDAIIKMTSNKKIITKYLDLSKLSSVRKFAKDILETEEKIDILMNNAGIGAASKCCTKDGLNVMMQVNYFGHVLLSYLLLDKLKIAESPRVIFLSSLMANIHDLTLENLNETNFRIDAQHTSLHYANSKLCSILAAQEMSKEFKEYGITVNSVDPGIVRTSIFSRACSENVERQWTIRVVLEILLLLFRTDPYFSAQTMLFLASENEIGTGFHFFRCRIFDKPGILSNEGFCIEIWRKTKELIGVEL